MTRTGALSLLLRGAALLLAFAAALVSAGAWLIGAGMVYEAWPSRPVVAVLGAGGFAAFVLLLIFGTHADRGGVRLSCRAAILFIACCACLGAIEVFHYWTVLTAVAPVDLENYVVAFVGLTLLGLGLAGIRLGLGMQMRFWRLLAVGMPIALVVLILSFLRIFLA
jgi:hypothetical protein